MLLNVLEYATGSQLYVLCTSWDSGAGSNRFERLTKYYLRVSYIMGKEWVVLKIALACFVETT